MVEAFEHMFDPRRLRSLREVARFGGGAPRPPPLPERPPGRL